MFRFQRFALSALAAVGLWAGSAQPTLAGSVGVSADLHYPLPSLNDGSALAAALHVSVWVAPGWRLGGLRVSNLADGKGNVLWFWELERSPFLTQLGELSSGQGGSAVGYYGGFDIYKSTPPGLYDRDSGDLNKYATFSAYAYDEQGNRAEDSVRISFMVTVPEPTSALLLGVGLMIPAGGVWLRRRRAG